MSESPVYLDAVLLQGLVLADRRGALHSGQIGTSLTGPLLDWEALAVVEAESGDSDLSSFAGGLARKCRSMEVSEFIKESRQDVLSNGSVVAVTAATPLELTDVPGRSPEDVRVLFHGDFFRRDNSEQTVLPWRTPWRGNSVVQVVSVDLFYRASALFREDPPLPPPADFVADAVSGYRLPSRVPVLGECNYAHCRALGVVGEHAPYHAVFFPDSVGEAHLWDGSRLASVGARKRDSARHVLHVAALWCTPSELNNLQALSS